MFSCAIKTYSRGIDGSSTTPNTAAASTPTPTPGPSTPTPVPTATPAPLPPGTGTTYTVTSSSQWTAALSTLHGGDTIIINYNSTGLAIKNKIADAAHWVTIKAANKGVTTLKSINITGCEYVQLVGFKVKGFDGGDAIKLVDSRHIKIIGNKLDYTGMAAAGGLASTGGNCFDIEVAYNEFNNHNLAGAWSGSYIKTGYVAPADADATTPAGIAQNWLIHHNYFANMAPRTDIPGSANPYAGDSDRETIIFGDQESQSLETNHIIEYNLFENCDGENEMTAFKTSKNVFRYNTVKNSMGGVSIRFGHGSEVYGNFFYGDPISDFSDAAYTAHANYETAGVRIYGTNHKVYNNLFVGLTAAAEPVITEYLLF